VSVLLLSQAGVVFRKQILYRDLFILQRLNSSVFDPPNAPNALKVTWTVNVPTTLVEHLRTHYPAFISRWM